MKRFTETTKWNDPWYRELPNTMKCVWHFILDHCDVAGIWVVDFKIVSFYVNESVDEVRVMAEFNKGKLRVKELSGGSSPKWFIPQFIIFQYGALSKESPPHKKIISILDREGLPYPSVTPRGGKPYPKPRVQEEEEDKEEEKDINIYNTIINDLNYILSTSYKGTTLKTKQLIKQRLRDGFTFTDFQRVHRNMENAWGSDQKMIRYLRPETLYSNKFEGYLNYKELKVSTAGAKTYKAGLEWIEEKEKHGKEVR